MAYAWYVAILQEDIGESSSTCLYITILQAWHDCKLSKIWQIDIVTLPLTF